MCGIAGLVDTDQKSVPLSLLNRMSEQMRARGPDASGHWTRDEVGFAHSRLRVIDLNPHSDQPMLNPAKDVCVVFNGEIYNYLELKSQLTSLGRQFRTGSDTEVVLQAYEEWGHQAFLKFNGMFAIAIADFTQPERPLLTLARDRFGIKPLYYAHQPGQFAFASEVRALMQVPWVSHDIDPQTLFWYLKFSHVPNPQSMLKEVSQLEPGHFMIFQGGVLQKSPFWQWDGQIAPLSKSHCSADWLAETSEVLSAAVRRQMVSDVPVGCFLSGGVDSSILISEAVKVNSQIQTFTVGYAEQAFDETPFARTVADHFKVNFNPVLLTAHDIESYMTGLADRLDHPLGDPTLIPTLLLCQEARKKVTVALSGDGGDEMFFGYRYQEVLWWLYPLTRFPASLRKAVFSRLRRLLASLKNPEFSQWIKALDVLQFKTEAELFHYFIGTFGPMPLNSLRQLLNADLRDGVKTVPNRFEIHIEGWTEETWSKKIEAIFIRTFLLDTVLAKSDRSGMAYGLEVRVPFLDNEVLNLSLRMPFAEKFNLFQTKNILRRRLSRDLPRAITQRPKRGFSVPLRDWMRGPLKPMLAHYLSKKSVEAEGIFDSASLKSLLDEHQSGLMNHSHLIWSILMFRIWNERYRGGHR